MKWTNESEALFDELTAGLSETGQIAVRHYATDCPEEIYTPEEAISEGVYLAAKGVNEEGVRTIEALYEPAWDREAVKLLMNLVQENPDWNTPDGIDMLMDEAENRSRVNNNDTVTALEVNEAWEACN